MEIVDDVCRNRHTQLASSRGIKQTAKTELYAADACLARLLMVSKKTFNYVNAE
jgi:hypothetical protein